MQDGCAPYAAAPTCVVCRAPATLYCRNDDAFLCARCDAQVHGTNTVLATHERVPCTLLSGPAACESRCAARLPSPPPESVTHLAAESPLVETAPLPHQEQQQQYKSFLMPGSHLPSLISPFSFPSGQPLQPPPPLPPLQSQYPHQQQQKGQGWATAAAAALAGANVGAATPRDYYSMTSDDTRWGSLPQQLPPMSLMPTRGCSLDAMLMECLDGFANPDRLPSLDFNLDPAKLTPPAATQETSLPTAATATAAAHQAQLPATTAAQQAQAFSTSLATAEVQVMESGAGCGSSLDDALVSSSLSTRSVTSIGTFGAGFGAPAGAGMGASGGAGAGAFFGSTQQVPTTAAMVAAEADSFNADALWNSCHQQLLQSSRAGAAPTGAPAAPAGAEAAAATGTASHVPMSGYAGGARDLRQQLQQQRGGSVTVAPAAAGLVPTGGGSMGMLYQQQQQQVQLHLQQSLQSHPLLLPSPHEKAAAQQGSWHLPGHLPGHLPTQLPGQLQASFSPRQSAVVTTGVPGSASLKVSSARTDNTSTTLLLASSNASTTTTAAAAAAAAPGDQLPALSSGLWADAGASFRNSMQVTGSSTSVLLHSNTCGTPTAAAAAPPAMLAVSSNGGFGGSAAGPPAGPPAVTTGVCSAPSALLKNASRGADTTAPKAVKAEAGEQKSGAGGSTLSGSSTRDSSPPKQLAPAKASGSPAQQRRAPRAAAATAAAKLAAAAAQAPAPTSACALSEEYDNIKYDAIVISPYREDETRADKLARYRAKKLRRKFKPTVRYQCRKHYADLRPRIKGRFVSPEEFAAWQAQHGGGCVRSSGRGSAAAGGRHSASP